MQQPRDQQSKRSVVEIVARATPALGDTYIRELINSGSSPSAVYEIILQMTNDDTKAKAARWLAILKRDYEQEYEKMTKCRS